MATPRRLKLDIPSANLRAEFKPLLSTINISIELSRSLTSVPSRLTIEPGKINLHSDILKVEFVLDGVTLKPGSCRGLRWVTSNELQLTLEAVMSLQACGDADSSLGNQQFCQDQLVSKVKACQSRCYCVGCGAQIFTPGCQFKRILPLPSENWADFADIWFCHNHGEEESIPNGGNKRSGLTPRPDDCLVSSLYMLVQARHVRPCSVSHVLGKLMCRRCGNFLGFVKTQKTDADTVSDKPVGGDVYKIYFHAICFRDECEEAPLFKNALHQGMKSNSVAKRSEEPIEEFVCHLLKDQSHGFTSFRFIVDSSMHDDEPAGVVILLWLLDQNLTVYHFSSKNTPASPNSTESSLNNLLPWGYSSTSDCPIKPGQPCKLMKVLYKAQFQPHSQDEQKGDDVFKSWDRDNTVHGISLPYPLCKQLLDLLIKSTKKLAPSQRNLNGFHVGYLRSS